MVSDPAQLSQRFQAQLTAFGRVHLVPCAAPVAVRTAHSSATIAPFPLRAAQTETILRAALSVRPAVAEELAASTDSSRNEARCAARASAQESTALRLMRNTHRALPVVVGRMLAGLRLQCRC